MNIKKMILAALMLALGMVLPFLTMQVPTFGSMLLPMHIPVLLAGFICGAPLATMVGFILPILRSGTLGMPPMFPTALAMSIELAVYGFVVAIYYEKSKKTTKDIYISLLVSMLLGRLAWGVTTYFFVMTTGSSFTFSMFLAGAFTKAIPGILLQFVLIPLLVTILQRNKVLERVNTTAYTSS